MRHGLNKLIVFFLAVVVPELSHAGLITFAFEGVVTSSNREAVFPIGQSISGQYSFDSTVEDGLPLNTEQGVYDAVREFTFVSGTYAVNATPSNSANSGGKLQ